jgi:coproporphyrinogen III oxidase
MSEQVQHSLLDIGIKELKTLLFDKEERTELLNQQLRIYLAVNEKAQAIAYKHRAEVVITINLHFGVRIVYFDNYGTRMLKTLIHDDVIKIAESARKKLHKKYRSIVQEEWKRKYTILESVIGDRSKQLERPDRFIDNFFIDRYTSFPLTTVEERETLAHLGIEVSICQE